MFATIFAIMGLAFLTTGEANFSGKTFDDHTIESTSITATSGQGNYAIWPRVGL